MTSSIDRTSDPGMQFPTSVPPTLVQYDPPIFAGLEPSLESNSIGGGGPDPRLGISQGKTSQMEDMLKSMLPPREWTEETGTWMQYASKEPATRLSVLKLQAS